MLSRAVKTEHQYKRNEVMNIVWLKQHAEKKTCRKTTSETDAEIALNFSTI